MKSGNNKSVRPKWDASLPTSFVKLGTRKVRESELRNGDYVGISIDTQRGQNLSAGVFPVKIIENRDIDETGLRSQIGINPNVAAAFGLPTEEDALRHKNIRLDIDLNAGPSRWTECTSVKICPRGIGKEELKQFLIDDQYLIHRIEEVVGTESGNQLVPFLVADMEPSGFNTLRVTRGTEFEWLSEEEARKFLDRTPARTQRESDDRDEDGVGSGQSRGQDTDNFEVDIRRPEEDFDVTFDDVAGLEGVKERSKVVYGLADPSVREQVAAHGDLFVPEEGNAVLLYGPPGCGKTMISKAIAREFHEQMSPKMEVSFASVEGSDILGKYQGESEERMSKAFAQAKDLARDGHFCILFFDEIEALVKDRSGEGVAAHHQQLTATFLQEMNNVGRDVMVIGATNLPFEIDSAATRRFKTEIFVPHPGEEGMTELWRTKLDNVSTVGSIDYSKLGRLSAEFTPSEITNRLLQSEIQSELVLSALDDGENDIDINEDYLCEKIKNTEPKVIDRYISQVTQDFDDMGGYEELQNYIVEQYEKKQPDNMDE